MNPRIGKRPLLWLQILAIPIFIGSGFATIMGIAARPRVEAQEKTKEPIPADWEWVVLNHGKPIHWPYRGMTILFGLSCVGALAFLILSGASEGGWGFFNRKDGES